MSDTEQKEENKENKESTVKDDKEVKDTQDQEEEDTSIPVHVEEDDRQQKAEDAETDGDSSEKAGDESGEKSQGSGPGDGSAGQKNGDSHKNQNGQNKNGNRKNSGKNNNRKKGRNVHQLEMEIKAQSEVLDEAKRRINVKEEEIKKIQQQSDDFKDKYTRLMAEFDNMRKRTEKESAHQYDVGAKDVLEKLLPVVDNFERASATVSDEQKDDPYVQGMEKIRKQLTDFLTSVHVTPMDAQGKEFDPNLHNAVMHVDDDSLGENVVVEELQKGYMYKDEVLRHSMVKVAN